MEEPAPASGCVEGSSWDAEGDGVEPLVPGQGSDPQGGDPKAADRACQVSIGTGRQGKAGAEGEGLEECDFLLWKALCLSGPGAASSIPDQREPD